MDRTARLIERAAALGCAVAPDAAARVIAFLDAMLELNRQLNLTAVREVEAADVLHALDAVAVELVVSEPPRRALDIGSGNGFPAVAVAACWPHAEVVLMERTGKKARALRDLLAAASITNARVAHLDAAQAPALEPELRGAFDLVTARAVADPETVARLAAPMCSEDAQLVLWLDAGAETPEELARSFVREGVVAYPLPEPCVREHRLACYRR